MGTQARLMSAALRKLTTLISRARTTCILRTGGEDRRYVWESGDGGKALKFYSSVRIDIRRISAIKNRLAPPFSEAEFYIIGQCSTADPNISQHAP